MPSDGDWLDELLRNEVDDEVFLALSDGSRRMALYYLRSRDSVDVETLADVVTGWSAAGRRGTATREDRDRVLIELCAQHLPLLSDAGLVDYDQRAGVVTLERLSEPVRTLLDAAYAREGSRNAVY